MASPGVFLDGVDYTRYVTEGSVTHQHNRPTFSTVELVSLYAPADDPVRCKVVLPNGELDFHGMIVSAEDEGKTDDATTQFTFADPTTIFEYRPCRDGAPSGDQGDFSNPTFVHRNMTAPQMLYEVLDQSLKLDVYGPDDAEGPMGIQLGTFKAGGVDLRGAPIDWPITIADFIALMVETGELDVICQPIDPGNGDMGLIHAFNGNYGRDLSGSVSFEYATGSHNAREAKRTRDYRELMNKLWIYLGPRVKTPADPGALQHWRRNITGDDEDNFPPGYSAIRARALASREKWYPRMLIRIFDGQGKEAPSLLWELYKRWFMMETYLRAEPATHVHLTPNVGIYPTFRCGDLIHVAAGPKLRGGFSGAQRVMEYTYRWEKQGNIELGAPVAQSGAPAVVTTADNEGVRSGPLEGSYS